MAEIAVGLLVDKLTQFLTEEADLLRGCHKEVEEISRDLRYIQAFLKDADRRAEAEAHEYSHGVKLWVKELREAAFKINDVIDEYKHFMVQQEPQDEHLDEHPPKRRYIGRAIQGISRPFVNLKWKREIVCKIQDLRQILRSINERSATYGFNSSQQESSSFDAKKSTSWSDPRDDSRFLKETEVVGIQTDREELVARLKGENPQRMVIALIGMPGIGKTTLANQVYDLAKSNFDCHAWIDVSQSYNKVELIKNLIRKFYKSRTEPAPEGTDHEIDLYTLTKMLRDYLQGKSYFVTFDDVWNEHFWADIKNALPKENGKCGSILVTSRHMEVANFFRVSSPVHIHQLKLLSFKNSWELFCSKAFHSDPDKDCPAHLERLSHEIVQRCRGLPLAIVVIASLLATKNKNVDEWKKLLCGLSSELESNKHLTSIKKILSLSYDDLPHYLKPCFLYFGIFPEDYSIRYRRLIRLWIAEGFVKQKNGKTSEAVAEECLAELINRSMVQLSNVDVDGKAKSCRIHDVLHEFILKKMEDLDFCTILSNHSDVRRLPARRMSFLNSSYDTFASDNTPSGFEVQSVFVFDKNEMPNSLGSTIATNFRLLKVLDFEDAPSLDQLPNDIGNLFHLRYLSVRGTRVKSLPKSIKNLENLETLDLKKSLVYELPTEINSLRKLRHFLAYHSDDKTCFSLNSRRRGVKMPKGFGCLKALERLYLIEADVEGVDVFEELRRLTELRKLVISNVRSDDGRALCRCVEELKHLEALEVYSVSEDEPIDFESMSSPPQFLRGLYLHGRLRKFPEWITNLQNLVKILIRWSKLPDDPLKALQKLPNLLVLDIMNDAYYGEKLQFEEGGFPKLIVLRLYWLSRLNTLVIEEGALPKLEELWIRQCPQLKEELSGFQHLKNLIILKFLEMPALFLLFHNGEYLLCHLEDVFKIQKYIRGKLFRRL